LRLRERFPVLVEDLDLGLLQSGAEEAQERFNVIIYLLFFFVGGSILWLGGCPGFEPRVA
jgi:hypothetical protein